MAGGAGDSRPMRYQELVDVLEHVGKDPSRLIFEDELTGIHNRRFLLSYFDHRVRWESGEDYPLALLVLDLDRFKEVNDTHGHEVGDQLLTWVATLLTEVVGDEGMPIRYGGDEFTVVLPNATRREGREVAARLLQRTRDRPFRVRSSGTVVPITLSIGVASAPEDAQDGQGLLQAADTALYYAKQSGRDRAATAGEVDPAKVFPKTALHRLKVTGIVGRDDELTIVADALEALSKGQSRFLIFEGAPGIGKTTLLETIRDNLTLDDSYSVTKVSGDQKEAYRPYYLLQSILVSLLNDRDDKGVAILEAMSEDEIARLAHVLPRLADEDAASSRKEPDSSARQAIFATLARFLPRLVEFRPLMLIIDDLQFTDEATLLLLRVLMERNELSLFVCGAAMESVQLGGEREALPLDRFLRADYDGLDVHRARLQPLSANDIAKYLGTVFPSLRMPDGFQNDLADTTQGNPLFLVEIIRKLVADRKVALVGQEWVIEPLEEGYLPKSLEEIVIEKIAELDDEGMDLLARASTFGEDISVSMLAGSADLDENRVLEFLDRAETLGLVKMDFQVNDEVMRFLGKRVLDISYGSIDDDRRSALHEQVGNYQERLYQQRLLPSASLLAYHFKRSANEEKARQYERVQVAYTQTVFDASEASHYTGQLLDEIDTGTRLERESLPLVPHVLRNLMTAVRNIQLYPPESAAITQAMEQIKQPIDEILETNERLLLSQADNLLLVNGQRLEMSESRALTESFLELLGRLELKGIAFRRGITQEQLRTLVVTLGRMKSESVEPGFWRELAIEKNLDSVELLQVQYSRVRKSRKMVAVVSVAEDEKLSAAELKQVPEVLRALHGAATNVKLYPVDAQPVVHAIEGLHSLLERLLGAHPALTLAHLGQSLLVNGAKVDTGAYDAVAEGFITFLRSIGLDSITFFAPPSSSELENFIGALRDLPASGTERSFWDDLTAQYGLQSVAFNQRQYALGVVQSLLSEVEVPDEVEVWAVDATAAELESLPEDSTQAVREAVPRFGKELLVKGEHKALHRLLRALFNNFSDQDPLGKEQAVGSCARLLNGLILGLQHKFAELAVDHLLGALSEEGDPRIVQQVANVLLTMSGCAVQFADYQLAGRIHSRLRERREQLKAAGESSAETLAKLLDRKLDPTTERLLEGDLTSGDPVRHERAAQVVGNLGPPAIPLLVHVIEHEKDFRVRQTAASLLAELGPEAAKELKRAIVTGVLIEQRFRVMEVVETVTQDLRNEIEFCLEDSNRKIRRAAFQLLERLGRDDLIDILLPYAHGDDPARAKGAIRSLGSLASKAAAAALAAIPNATKDSELVIVCCQALGRIGDEMCIEALQRVLRRRRFLFFGRRWNEQVRAMAAMALKQISGPQAAKVLSRFTRDGHGRVQQLARSAVSSEA